VVKTIKVPILLDPAPEVPDPEDALMHLSNPTNGATLGLEDSTLLIFDYDPAYPGVSIDDATIVEGNAGQKMLSFAVHMSPSDHDVTIAYLTEDGTAVQGEDYEYTEGELFFPVGTDVQYIQVPIDGDLVIEGDETFTTRLTVAPGGGVWVAFDALATGTILEDDDPEGGSPLFIDGFEIGSTVVWSETTPDN
jgi:chitinase